MMLPVSVMKVMPTATQPMKEIALSSALMLSGEVKPGVVSAQCERRQHDSTMVQTMRRRRSAGEPARRSEGRAVVAGVRDFAHAATGMGDVGQHALHVASPRR